MPLLPRDRVERSAKTASRASPDFHKHQHRAVQCDDVQLSASRAEAAVHNHVSAAPQLVAREIFTELAERDARVFGQGNQKTAKPKPRLVGAGRPYFLF